MKETVMQTILEQKLILILRALPAEKLLSVVKACFENGVRVCEVTFLADREETWCDTCTAISLIKHRFPEMTVGAGTVLYPKQVKMAKKAGAELIVSPNADKKVIKETNRLGLVSIPGAYTATEAQNAHLWGADFVKLFPAGTDAGHLKALRAPLSHIRFLAVGGVTPETVPAFLQAGALGFGISSGIVAKKALEENNFADIGKKAKEYIDKINEAKA